MTDHAKNCWNLARLLLLTRNLSHIFTYWHSIAISYWACSSFNWTIRQSGWAISRPQRDCSCLSRYRPCQICADVGLTWDGYSLSGQWAQNQSGPWTLTSSQGLYQYPIARWAPWGFAVLCLDNALNLLNFEILFTGGISSCSVCIKHVLRHAISHAASQLIVAHNHPHTDSQPSTADNLLTYELRKACDLLDLSLVDHIIVGRNDTLSYAENGLAPFNWWGIVNRCALVADTYHRHSVAFSLLIVIETHSILVDSFMSMIYSKI